MLRKILIGLLVVLVLIQFIRPERNQAATIGSNDIAAVYNVPDSVQTILKQSCYDCHSNNTTYPWYTNIQPLGLWMQNHVNEGKEHLNFSEYGNYSKKDQRHIFEEIAEEVEEGHMPLNSYLWMHGSAKLNEQQKQAIVNWAKASQAI